jgi:hypothetical protein
MTDVDLSEFYAKSHQRGGQMCGVRRVREELDGERLEKFNAAVENRAISAKAISKVLDEWGLQLGLQPIGNHRRGNCACG